MTTKKDQRWAIPPAAPSGDDVTQTHRRIRTKDQAPRDSATSRHRKRTEPEIPALDELAQQVAPSTPRPRPVEPAPAESLSSPLREAVTAPPDAHPTIVSLTHEPESSRRVTLVDLAKDDHIRDDLSTGAIDPEGIGAAATPTIVERSRATGPAPSDHGETLPSPPWRDDDR